MADETNRLTTDETEKSGQEHDKPENKIPSASGDPGRTPGAAEGDEETIDEDIRQKEAEGKL
jgi:hypothetical protein